MTRVKSFFGEGRAIYVLVALFVLLGTLYSVTTPIFEAGDELWHYPHVQLIATGHGLPVQDPTQKQLWEQEGGQPPLFYVLSAALTFWIDTGDMQARLWRNPYAKIGIPLAYGNKNMVVHTNAESFPWQGTTLAVHLIRLLSVLFSAGTVFFTYRIAREILGRQGRDGRRTADDGRQTTDDLRRSEAPALLAAGIVAFNPMFLFISASVNNDALAALTATVALYVTVQLVTRGATNRRVILLGILVGLAILAKVSNLALGVVVEAVLAYCAWRDKKLSTLLLGSILFLIPIVVLDAWWFARNYALYGDPTAFNVWLEIAGGRPPQTLLGLLGEFQGFRISYWGNFGGVNVIAPDWVYTMLDAFTLVAFVGLGVGVARRRLPPLLEILTIDLVVVFVALVRWTLLTYASQGRLIFPAIAAVSILMTFGLYEIAEVGRQIAIRLSPPVSRFSPLTLPALFALLLFCFALVAPFAIIAPAYAQPARVTDEAQVPNPVHITFDARNAQPELIGFETEKFLPPGQDLPLTLYWRTASPIDQDLAMYIHVYDVQGHSLGQWDAYPGNGVYPPQLWQPNEIIVDQYRVPVTAPDVSPPIGRIEVGMARVGSSTVLPARNPQGETITPSLAQFKFSETSGILAAPRVTFADQFNLLSLNLSTTRAGQVTAIDSDTAATVALKPGVVLNLKVTLQARQSPDADYTLFAHVADSNGKIVAQRDAQPLDNTYPTGLWDKNEQVTDTLAMEIPNDTPAGDYVLEFGIYRAGDLQRLPVNGNPWGVWRVQGDHVVAKVQVMP